MQSKVGITKERYLRLVDSLESQKEALLEKIQALKQLINEAGLGSSYWARKNEALEKKLESKEFAPSLLPKKGWFAIFNYYPDNYSYDKECVDITRKIENLKELIEQIEGLFIILSHKKLQVNQSREEDVSQILNIKKSRSNKHGRKKKQ